MLRTALCLLATFAAADAKIVYGEVTLGMRVNQSILEFPANSAAIATALRDFAIANTEPTYSGVVTLHFTNFRPTITVFSSTTFMARFELNTASDVITDSEKAMVLRFNDLAKTLVAEGHRTNRQDAAFKTGGALFDVKDIYVDCTDYMANGYPEWERRHDFGHFTHSCEVDDDLSGGQIFGLVIGALVVVGLIIGLFLLATGNTQTKGKPAPVTEPVEDVPAEELA